MGKIVANPGMLDALNSNITSIKGKLRNARFIDYFNANELSIDVGFTPSNSKNGNAIMVNANQGIFAILRLDTTPNIVRISGSLSFNISYSGTVFTITPSATLCGLTTVIVTDNNY